MRTWSLFLLYLLMVSYVWRQPGAPDNQAGAHDNEEKLGTVSFPTSCSAEVQKKFERGVALVHSFEYAKADIQFQEVAAADPNCAMAYWGQGMSLFHPMSDRPTRQDLKDGRQLLQQAR